MHSTPFQRFAEFAGDESLDAIEVLRRVLRENPKQGTLLFANSRRTTEKSGRAALTARPTPG